MRERRETTGYDSLERARERGRLDALAYRLPSRGIIVLVAGMRVEGAASAAGGDSPARSARAPLPGEVVQNFSLSYDVNLVTQSSKV